MCVRVDSMEPLRERSELGTLDAGCSTGWANWNTFCFSLHSHGVREGGLLSEKFKVRYNFSIILQNYLCKTNMKILQRHGKNLKGIIF